LLVGLQSESLHYRRRPLAGGVDIGFDFLLDFDELAEAVDGVECDRVAVETIPGAVFRHLGGGVVSEAGQDIAKRVGVRDHSFGFLTRLRFLLDERPFVGESCLGAVVTPLSADPECFVGLREVPVGSIIVHVRLFDGAEKRRVGVGEALADRLVVSTDFQFHFVHTSRLCSKSKRAIGRRPGRNVVLKSATPERDRMSNDSEATEADDEAEDAATEQVDGLQEEDFIKLAYTARTVEDGDLVDTTDEEVAEEADVDTESQEFAPRTIVLGQGHIFESVEDDIVGKDVGDEGSVTVPAKEAFGEYDDEEVRTVSKDKIPEDDRYPGAQIQIDQQQGFIETIIGGRARVDFNHPLAGEDIEYEYEILEEVTDREEMAQGIISMMLDMELDVWFQTDTVEEEQLVDDEKADDDEDEGAEPEFETVEVEKETLYIEATPQLSMNQQWMMGKQQIAQQLTDLLDIDRIIVQEELGGGMGMGGMMGGMGGMGGAGGDVDLEEALEDADIDADELAEEIDE